MVEKLNKTEKNVTTVTEVKDTAKARHAYYLKNKEKYKETVKAYYIKNKEKIRETKRAYHLKNKEKYRENAAKWAKENPEKRAKNQKKYNLKVKDKINKYDPKKDRVATDGNFKIKTRPTIINYCYKKVIEDLNTIRDTRKTRNAYYLKNKEKFIEKSSKWIKENPEKRAKIQKKYNLKVKDKINKYNSKVNKDRAAIDDNFKIKTRLMARHTQFINGTLPSFKAYTGLGLAAYKDHIRTLMTKRMNWDNYGKKWRIQRVRGLKELNLKIEEDVKEFCSFKNIKLVEINRIKIKN